MESTPEVYDKKKQHAWAMYDWANSAYNLVITTTIFPAYYIASTRTQYSETSYSDQVQFLGESMTNTVLYDYALAFAYLIIAFLSPLLSSIADIKGNKKRFLRFFSYLGALACMGLYFYTPARLEWGLACFVIAAIGYCGSLVFYNAYLPEIAAPHQRNALSAKGYALGYIGSVLLQLVCFILVLQPQWFGIQDPSLPARLSFLLVGIWWLGFAQIPLRRLPSGKPLIEKSRFSLLTHGFREIQAVAKQLRSLPTMRRFLAAFFFYSMGVQTVMLAATLFGSREIGMETQELILIILIIQLVAILGAWLIARMAQAWGNIPVLTGVVGVWILICLWAYFLQTKEAFYAIAVVVGLVMGGIQSLSRATFSILMPPTRDTASFFSFYDVCEKLSIVLGMFSFGLIESITGSMRQSIIALTCYFVVGGLFLYIAMKRRGQSPRLLKL